MKDQKQDNDSLITEAKKILQTNGFGDFTIPASGLYPHQVLWDSCFIAIGKSHYDIPAAQGELRSLLRGQWHNGMIPHIIFNQDTKYKRDHKIWNSKVNSDSPNIFTSGITQPPMLAIAVNIVGSKLSGSARRVWYWEMLPPIVRYHEWLYRERDPKLQGLVFLIHPWETGLDTTPPWMEILRGGIMPDWIKFLEKSRLYKIGELFRTDTKFVPASQRSSSIEALALYIVQRHLMKAKYAIKTIMTSPQFAIQDLSFNSILVKANSSLLSMANEAGYNLPEGLKKNIVLSETAINKLCWDPTDNQYYSRNFLTEQLIKNPTIATFMPLYAGAMPNDRLPLIVNQLSDQSSFGAPYPIPSAPLNSPWFKQKRYWQGPSWVNTNWFVIQGLRQSGQIDEANRLTQSTLNMIKAHGFYEYFDPLSGEGAGSNNFSWTAALALDLATV